MFARTVILAVTLTWCAVPCYAQEGPGAAAASFFAALERSEWIQAVYHVDPHSLSSFRESRLAQFVEFAARQVDSNFKAQEPSVEALVSTGGVSSQKLREFSDSRIHAVLGTPTLAELAALTPEEFAALYLASVYAEPARIEATPYQSRSLNTIRYRVIGAAREGEDIGHVLYRAEGESIRHVDSLHVDVLRARRIGGQWFVQLDRNVPDDGLMLTRLMQSDRR